MGLSAFNAMRARQKARELAEKKSAETRATVETLEVKEVSTSEVEENTVVEEIKETSTTAKISTKKTDTEKLKKKE